jgi:ATP-dependent RNA helicase DDX43
MTRSDWSQAEELIKILTEANQEVPEELTKMAERFKVKKEKDAQERELYGGKRGGRGGYGNQRNRW